MKARVPEYNPDNVSMGMAYNKVFKDIKNKCNNNEIINWCLDGILEMAIGNAEIETLTKISSGEKDDRVKKMIEANHETITQLTNAITQEASKIIENYIKLNTIN